MNRITVFRNTFKSLRGSHGLNVWWFAIMVVMVDIVTLLWVYSIHTGTSITYMLAYLVVVGYFIFQRHLWAVIWSIVYAIIGREPNV